MTEVGSREVPARVLDGVQAALEKEPEHERVVFDERVRRYWPDLLRGLQLAYGPMAETVAERALSIAVDGFLQRPAELRLLDLRRTVDPGWFQHPGMLGYSCYTERFAGTLDGVATRAGYLAELGVRYLHLTPLLTPRPRPNDGGTPWRTTAKCGPISARWKTCPGWPVCCASAASR